MVFEDKLHRIAELGIAVVKAIKDTDSGRAAYSSARGALEIIAVQDLKVFRIERIASTNINAVERYLQTVHSNTDAHT